MLRVALLALALLLSGGPAAQAADVALRFDRTVQVDEGRGGSLPVDRYELVVVAAPGERNDAEVSFTGGGVSVRDRGAPLRPGPGCTAQEERVVCTTSGFAGARGAQLGAAHIDLGDGDDLLALRPGTLLGGGLTDRVDAGPGDDVVRVIGGGAREVVVAGGPGADRTSGEDGAAVRASYAERTAPVVVTLDDRADDGEPGEGDRVSPTVAAVEGGAGDDTLAALDRTPQGSALGLTGVRLAGGPGADQLLGSPGTDRLEGADGRDLLAGGPGDDDLDGGVGADVLRGGDGSDRADYGGRAARVVAAPGGGADDGEPGEGDDVGTDVERLRGGAGADALSGGDGPQELDGGPGADVLAGGPGNDRLVAADGEDVVDGGPGADAVTARGPVTLQLVDGAADMVQCLGRLTAPVLVEAADRLSGPCRPVVRVLSRAVRPDARGVLRPLVVCTASPLPCAGRIVLRRYAARGVTTLVSRAFSVPADGRRRQLALRLGSGGRSLVGRLGPSGTRTTLIVGSTGADYGTSATLTLLPPRR